MGTAQVLLNLFIIRPLAPSDDDVLFHPLPETSFA
jgi:hypothetical protein